MCMSSDVLSQIGPQLPRSTSHEPRSKQVVAGCPADPTAQLCEIQHCSHSAQASSKCHQITNVEHTAPALVCQHHEKEWMLIWVTLTDSEGTGRGL